MKTQNLSVFELNNSLKLFNSPVIRLGKKLIFSEKTISSYKRFTIPTFNSKVKLNHLLINDSWVRDSNLALNIVRQNYNNNSDNNVLSSKGHISYYVCAPNWARTHTFLSNIEGSSNKKRLVNEYKNIFPWQSVKSFSRFNKLFSCIQSTPIRPVSALCYKDLNSQVFVPIHRPLGVESLLGKVDYSSKVYDYNYKERLKKRFESNPTKNNVIGLSDNSIRKNSLIEKTNSLTYSSVVSLFNDCQTDNSKDLFFKTLGQKHNVVKNLDYQNTANINRSNFLSKKDLPFKTGIFKSPSFKIDNSKGQNSMVKITQEILQDVVTNPYLTKKQQFDLKTQYEKELDNKQLMSSFSGMSHVFPNKVEELIPLTNTFHDSKYEVVKYWNNIKNRLNSPVGKQLNDSMPYKLISSIFIGTLSNNMPEEFCYYGHDFHLFSMNDKIVIVKYKVDLLCKENIQQIFNNCYRFKNVDAETLFSDEQLTKNLTDVGKNPPRDLGKKSFAKIANKEFLAMNEIKAFCLHYDLDLLEYLNNITNVNCGDLQYSPDLKRIFVTQKFKDSFDSNVDRNSMLSLDMGMSAPLPKSQLYMLSARSYDIFTFLWYNGKGHSIEPMLLLEQVLMDDSLLVDYRLVWAWFYLFNPSQNVPTTYLTSGIEKTNLVNSIELKYGNNSREFWLDKIFNNRIDLKNRKVKFIYKIEIYEKELVTQFIEFVHISNSLCDLKSKNKKNGSTFLSPFNVKNINKTKIYKSIEFDSTPILNNNDYLFQKTEADRLTYEQLSAILDKVIINPDDKESVKLISNCFGYQHSQQIKSSRMNVGFTFWSIIKKYPDAAQILKKLILKRIYGLSNIVCCMMIYITSVKLSNYGIEIYKMFDLVNLRDYDWIVTCKDFNNIVRSSLSYNGYYVNLADHSQMLYFDVWYGCMDNLEGTFDDLVNSKCGEYPEKKVVEFDSKSNITLNEEAAKLITKEVVRGDWANSYSVNYAKLKQNNFKDLGQTATFLKRNDFLTAGSRGTYETDFERDELTDMYPQADSKQALTKRQSMLGVTKQKFFNYLCTTTLAIGNIVHKPKEPAKSRTIYCEPITLINSQTYCLLPVENYIMEDCLNLKETEINRAKKMLNWGRDSYVCSDYSDFQAQHTSYDVKMYFVYVKQAFEEVFKNDMDNKYVLEYLTNLEWLIVNQNNKLNVNSKSNTHFMFTYGKMSSGERFTAIINTHLNKCYSKIIEKSLENWSKVIKIPHTINVHEKDINIKETLSFGDDQWMKLKYDFVSSLLINVYSMCGCVISKNKCLNGNQIFEWLRQMYYKDLGHIGSINRCITSLVGGNVEGSDFVTVEQRINECYNLLTELMHRGMDGEYAELLFENLIEKFTMIKVGKGKNQKIYGPINYKWVFVRKDQNGFGLPSLKNGNIISLKNVPKGLKPMFVSKRDKYSTNLKTNFTKNTKLDLFSMYNDKINLVQDENFEYGYIKKVTKTNFMEQSLLQDLKSLTGPTQQAVSLYNINGNQDKKQFPNNYDEFTIKDNSNKNYYDIDKLKDDIIKIINDGSSSFSKFEKSEIERKQLTFRSKRMEDKFKVDKFGGNYEKINPILNNGNLNPFPMFYTANIYNALSCGFIMLWYENPKAAVDYYTSQQLLL